MDLEGKGHVMAFYVLLYMGAVWQMGVGIASGRILDYGVDAGILLAIGLGIQLLKSRIVAIAAIVWFIFGSGITLLSIMYPDISTVSDAPGDLWHHLFPVLVMTFYAFRVAKVIFKYHNARKGLS